MKIFYRLSYLLIPCFIFATSATAQEYGSFEKYIDKEIRATHLLIVEAIQSEIQGNLIKGEDISYLQSNGNTYVVAESTIKTMLNYKQIELEMDAVISKFKESDAMEVKLSNWWAFDDDSSKYKASWSLKDNSSGYSMEFIVFFSSPEYEITVVTIPHNYISDN